jgi:hypothetical protein
MDGKTRPGGICSSPGSGLPFAVVALFDNGPLRAGWDIPSFCNR